MQVKHSAADSIRIDTREFATLADVVASDAIVEEEGGWVLFEGVDKFFDVRVRPICG